MEKLVIGVHPNEGTMRDPNPHVPWTAEEIAEDLAACAEAGACVAHFHARTPTGGADHSPQAYGEIMAAIRERCDLLLAPSLANVPGHDLARRVANVADNAGDPRTRADFLVAEMGCAAMDLWDPAARRFVTEDRVFVNDTATQLGLLAYARELRMTPWLPTFNVSWTRALTAHLESGAVTGPFVVHLILGGPEFPAAHPATVEGLRAHLDFLPTGHDFPWAVSAYRGDVFAVAEEAITRGGHIHIGVGDHHYADLGLPTNADLVHRIAELSRRLGREVATPDEARRILGAPAVSESGAGR